MNRALYTLLILVLLAGATTLATAGNPDRQGEAGAPELNMLPYARLAGFSGMNTSTVSGVEAMRLNVAGLSRIQQTEFNASQGIYLQGTGINMSAFGFAQKVGENGTLGVSIMALSFGDLQVTTVGQPEGTGATFSPTFFNVGLGYSHLFENKISVGILFRAISQRISDLSAQSFAVDAGVQYVTGDQDNFKFGISLRNIGAPMRFTGEGLSFSTEIPFEGQGYGLAVNQRSADFELQSALNLGGSYDFYLGEKNRLTILANFTSNSFSLDQIGAAAEFSFNEMVSLRGGYKYSIGLTDPNAPDAPIYTGISGGISIDVPVGRDEVKNGFGIDYAYRTTKLFNGTHNIGIRLAIN